MKNADTVLSSQIEEIKTPSVQYLFFDKNSIIHEFREGYSDIGNRLKTTETTSYHAFSVTKTFTALGILQLAMKSVIDIGMPVINYLPQFPYPPEITVGQLLSHSAGIPNPIPLRWIHLVGEHSSFDRDEYFNRITNRYNKVKFKPNEKFAYSNLGYVMLGQLIEAVTGLSYENYIRESVIKHLDLDKNELDFEISSNQKARGYHKNFSFSNLLLGMLIDKPKFMDASQGKWKPFKDNYVNGASYGGLIGTANAFARYVQELLKPGSRLITDEYKKAMLTENVTSNNVPTGMCLSWFTGELNGNRYYTHAGGGGGYYCEIRMYPDAGVGSVVMFNRTGMRDERFLDRPDLTFLDPR